MSDLISRDALFGKLLKRFKDIDRGRSWRNEHIPIYDAIRLDEIENLQNITLDIEPVDAAPVVHAKWLYDRPQHYKCSACKSMWGELMKRVAHFCPNCGAKTDAKEEE